MMNRKSFFLRPGKLFSMIVLVKVVTPLLHEILLIIFDNALNPTAKVVEWFSAPVVNR
jgi:hypothetical protein